MAFLSSAPNQYSPLDNREVFAKGAMDVRQKAGRPKLSQYHHSRAASSEWAPRRALGFTLLELLVALVILSLVLLLLTGGLQIGTKVWSDRDQSKISEVLGVQQLLRRVISEARPVMIENTPTVRRHVFFSGSENSVRFVAPMPEHLGVGGFYEVNIYLTEGGEAGNRVEMSWKLFRAPEGSSGPPVKEQRVILLEKVAELQFAYFGYRGLKEPARWYSDWEGLQSLPDLIRMRITYSEGNQAWPDLVVGTMVRSLTPIIEPEAE
jgi:general secretion pathway protein J